MLDSRSTETESVVSLCESLAEIAPAYYIYGNNEVEKFYDIPLNQTELDKKFGFDDETRDASKLLEMSDELEEKLSDVGMKVLKNEKDTIEVGTTKIDVYGVLTSNPSSFWSYSGGNFENYIATETDNLKITAIHEPTIFEEFTDVDSWGDLMLCGHTHGGTVRVPIIGPLYTHERGLLPERKGYYAYGRHDVAGRPLIISSGLLNNSILRINN
jgi:predicted MPP superfamily phosphohydrolase